MVDQSRQLDLRRITADNAAMAVAFLQAMPAGDRTFFKEPVDDDAVQRWPAEAGRYRWLLVDPDAEEAVAFLAVIPGQGWSAHVGELRLIVAPGHRRRGLGSLLARRALLEGLALGLAKLTVEVAADKAGDIEMFTTIGFDAEGLLKHHIRDAEGALRDLVVLSHLVSGVREDLAVLGIDEAVGLGDGA